MSLFWRSTTSSSSTLYRPAYPVMRVEGLAGSHRDGVLVDAAQGPVQRP
jgi:hypothetical protein